MRIRVERAGAEPIVVTAAPHRLRLCLLEAIERAYKVHGPAPGEFRVVIEEEPPPAPPSRRRKSDPYRY